VRTIKTLGIATAVALALISIAGAGMASASYFRSSAQPETWNGALSGKKHSLILGQFAAPFNCEQVAFSGETTSYNSGELTVSPQLSKCEHISGAPSAWKMNGCKFRFNAGSGSSFLGTMDITGCTAPMLYENIEGNCRTEIGNQNALGTITYSNTTVNGLPALHVVANLKGIAYTRWHTPACNEGQEGTFSDGAYIGEWNVTGATKVGGTQVGAEIKTGSLPAPAFASEEAPATIAGTTGAVHFTGLGGAGGGCAQSTLKGTLSTARAETMTLTQSGFSGCEVAGEEEPKGSITTGGCSYAFHPNGEYDIVGATCASNPITISNSGCVATIGPQTGVTGFKYTNAGVGKTRTLALAWGWTSPHYATYTVAGPKCLKQGTFTEASIRFGVTLAATNSKGEQRGLWLE
jgi:hypothetical protein